MERQSYRLCDFGEQPCNRTRWHGTITVTNPRTVGNMTASSSTNMFRSMPRLVLSSHLRSVLLIGLTFFPIVAMRVQAAPPRNTAKEDQTVENGLATRATQEQHWSYQPIGRPIPPHISKPLWVRNPIDNFVLAKLEAEGITPSAEAVRATLIRRLSLDLLGLLPSPAEVNAFVSDARPDAYERLVGVCAVVRCIKTLPNDFLSPCLSRLCG